jgi:hypothetical protein
LAAFSIAAIVSAIVIRRQRSVVATNPIGGDLAVVIMEEQDTYRFNTAINASQ